MEISANFDGGNIIFDSARQTDSANHAYLRIRKDIGAEFMQWFYFRAQNVKFQHLVIHITNASEAFSPEGWSGYQVCISYDRKKWVRCNTHYDGNELKIELDSEHNMVYFAYFPPFSYEQHLDLVAKAQISPLCNIDALGKTVESRDIDLLTIGEPSDSKKKIWILGRQHAGESMASWFVKGMIERLLDANDAVSIKLLSQAVFYVIPSMNLDGNIAGNIRVNGAGRDLNREWANPSEEFSPEVFYVKNKMLSIGVDMCLDIHGDEELPYNFVSRIDGIPNFDERLAKQQKMFSEAWKIISPDFQDKYGYPVDKPGKANLSICSKNIANTFRCLALTVEMPFKDNANLPDPEQGWSVSRSEGFGASLISTLLMIVNEL
ncbi:MAG: M14-type cytosolic carboxypeptidase [Bacteroidota bacterium]|nr:M14-type cytosolic carboxypeptidase [Bacteroidota bacterium]